MIKWIFFTLCITINGILFAEENDANTQPVFTQTAGEVAKISKLKKTELKEFVDALNDIRLDDAIRNEVINLLRRSEFSDLNSNLIKLLADDKESDRFKSFIIQHLGVSLLNEENKVSREEIARVLHTHLESKILVVKKESFLALLNVKDEVALKKMDFILKSDKEEECLEIAIRFAFKLNLENYKPNLRTHLKSANKDVKLVAIHYLGQWKDEQSKEFFKECLKSEDLQIYQAGKLSLKLLESKK